MSDVWIEETVRAASATVYRQMQRWNSGKPVPRIADL